MLPTFIRYEPHARRWLKMKRDYIHSLRDSLDLVVLGAWNGKGARSGVLGAFLMGALNTSTQLWESVCRVGSGFTQAQLAEVRAVCVSFVCFVFVPLRVFLFILYRR